MADNQHINIIAPNIRSGGGLELLEYLLEYINNVHKKVTVKVYVDSSILSIVEKKNREVIYLTGRLKKIRLFCKKINNGLYFGNLPPLVKTTNSMVYFHNPHIVSRFSVLFHRSSFSFFSKYILQKYYIKFFLKNVDSFACQNMRIKKNFMSVFNYDKVNLLPFFRLCPHQNIPKKYIYDFCYISVAAPHKNHRLMFDAFKVLAKKGMLLKIVVTIQDSQKDLIEYINYLNFKYKTQIVNVGILKKQDVCKLYQNSRCLIFPSKDETLGLPLIEAVDMGLDIIAADLKYVKEIISTPFLFNHESSLHCAQVIEQYINTDNPVRPIKKIENRIDKLINKFTKEE